MKKKYPTQATFLKTCRQGLTSPTFGEKLAGQCKRWVRQMQTAAGTAPECTMPTGITAKQAGAWWRRNHPDRICRHGSLPGDIYIWEEGHGPDGHMMVRELGNVLIGNSTIFAPVDQPDGRGTCGLERYGPPSLIVRPWRPNGT